MTRPIPPPPPRRNPPPPPRYGNLEDIDDDDDDDEIANGNAAPDEDIDDSLDIDDGIDIDNHDNKKDNKRADEDDDEDDNDEDSVVAMARRLDDASVISDPSFICGPEPHRHGVDPDAAHDGRQRRRRRPENDLYSIASNDDDSDDDSDVEANPHRRQRGEIYEDDSVATDDDSAYTGSTSLRSDIPMMEPRVGHFASGGAGPYDYYGTGGRNCRFQGVGHNTRLGGNGARGGTSMPPPPPPRAARKSNGPERSRKGGGGNKHSKGTANGHGRHNKAEKATKSKTASAAADDRDRSRRNRNNRNDNIDDDDDTDDNTSRRTSRRKKAKLIALPILIVIIVGVAVGVVVLLGRNNDDNNNNNDNKSSKEEQDLLQIDLPTSSPTFAGNYFCPPSYRGPMPTRGCLGYVNCDFGTVLGDVIPCPDKTLYDATTGTCNFAEDVECDTQAGAGAVESPRPTVRPTALAETTAATTTTTAATSTAAPPSEYPLIGPVTTYNHRLSFAGITDLGTSISQFERDLQNYLNLFFLGSGTHSVEGDNFQGVLSVSAENDEVLNRLSDVMVEVNVMTFELVYETRRRRERGLTQSRKITQQRSLQEEEVIGVIMTFDQTTEYRTADPPVPLKTIIRHPYEPEYVPALIGYLKTTDSAFLTLENVQFLDEDDTAVETESPTPSPTSSPTPSPTSASPSTFAPTIILSSPPTIPPSSLQTTPPPPPLPTSSPTLIATTVPPPTSTAPTAATLTSTPPPTSTTPPLATQPPTFALPAFEQYATIQGFLWYDENRDGLWQSREPPAQGAFLNLRLCDGDRWMGTQQSNAFGQYQFLAVEEGEYYLEFFRPTQDYEFTVRNAGGEGSALDSDADPSSGKTSCMAVGPGFDTLTNAGFVTVAEEGGDAAL